MERLPVSTMYQARPLMVFGGVEDADLFRFLDRDS